MHGGIKNTPKKMFSTKSMSKKQNSGKKDSGVKKIRFRRGTSGKKIRKKIRARSLLKSTYDGKII